MDNKKPLKVFRNGNNHLSEVGVGLGGVLGTEGERDYSLHTVFYLFYFVCIQKNKNK